MCLSIMKQAAALVIILIINTALIAFSLQNEHCGERLIKIRGLIVGGKISQRGMWPWQVGIYKKEVSGWQFRCGGALVSSQWVLTAAHCFYVKKNTTNRFWFAQDMKPITKYKIKVGDHELRSYESSEQERKFQEIFVHPDYRHDPIYENDIALVKLNREVILGPYVRTVCLPGPDLDLAKPGTVGMVAGWGITESGYGSSFLRYSSFTIETNNVCDREINFYYNKTVAFCASDVKGHSAPCSGDSGGSMVRKVFLNGKYRFVTIGLVSWGGCTLGSHFGYYTRLQPFLPWIYHKVNSTCMGPAQAPRNGAVTPAKSVYQPNEVIRFTCNIEYTRIGKSDLTCQRDGTWNGYWPLCLAPCPRPAQPKNGILLGNNFAHGHSVRVICSPRYRPIGSFVIACLNGKWTNKTPKCAAPCTDPGTPIDGHRYNHSFQHGDQVMFSCEKGKSLIGKKIITCNDGRWDQMTPKCSVECGSPLGMENREIPDKNIRASSNRGYWYDAKYARLHGPRAWCSGSFIKSPYLEIDLEKPYRITYIATQGSSRDNQWETKYTLSYALAKSTRIEYRENDKEKVFNGNSDATTVVKHKLKKSFIARKVHFHPVGYRFSGYLYKTACMRVEIYGCSLPTDCVMVGSRVLGYWENNYHGGDYYYRSYVKTIDDTYDDVELEIEDDGHHDEQFKTVSKTRVVLDVPNKQLNLPPGTRVLAPWSNKYFTGTITRNYSRYYQVRFDFNKLDWFRKSEILILKPTQFCEG